MCLCIVGLMQVTDLTEAANPLLQVVDSLPDGAILVKGNMTLINLNLAGNVFIIHIFI